MFFAIKRLYMQKENDAKAILFLQEIKCRFPPNLFDKKTR